MRSRRHPLSHANRKGGNRRLRLGLAGVAGAAILMVQVLRVMAASHIQMAVFRPATAEWIIRGDDGSSATIQFGAPGDVPVARDYLGQGRVQPALFRPSTREWFVRQESGPAIITAFGRVDDQPVPADYLGQGRAQFAVFRPSTQEWFVRGDDGTVLPIQFGGTDDLPVPADYLGLNRSQFAVFRSSTQEWFIRQDDGTPLTVQWGMPGDKPVPGDYLGLHHAQIAVFRPATGDWIIRQDNGDPLIVSFGSAEDMPMPADYDGNDRAKIAIFRPDTQEWLLRNDDGTFATVQFGGPGDVPVPAAYGSVAGTPPAPPAAPSNLVAAASSASQIALSWSDNSSSETGFRIERRGSNGSYTEIASVGANSVTYADGGLSASTSYSYRVRAVGEGGFSDYSNEVSATTQAPPATAPAPPSNLTAAVNSATQVTLAWSDNSTDETGFKVERRTGSGAFAEVGSLGANVVAFVDTGLTAATSYTYRVRAVNGVGPSAYSNEASGTTSAAATGLTLAKDIQAIFTQRCATSSCHAGARPEQNLDLSAGKAYSQTVNVTSQEVRSKKRVVPRDPTNSFLYEKISTNRPSSGSRMPEGGTLSAAEIDKIRQWIADGAQP